MSINFMASAIGFIFAIVFVAVGDWKLFAGAALVALINALWDIAIVIKEK